MHAHVGNAIRSVNFELRRISTIRHFLSVEATKTLVSAFVLSRLDYCNGLLINCSHDLTQRLQKVQNSAARLLLRVPRRDRITPYLRGHATWPTPTWPTPTWPSASLPTVPVGRVPVCRQCYSKNQRR